MITSSLNSENLNQVLIVDDEQELTILLGEIFLAAGVQVRLAEDGLVAKRLMEESEFDFVLSDIQMPEVDGIELLKDMKGKRPLTRFIMMTGNSDFHITHDVFSLGADAILRKPFSIDDLFQTMNQVLEKAV